MRLIFVLLFCASFAAIAKDTPEALNFSDLDANQDGFLSVEETKGVEALASQFGEIDENKDARIDQAEFSKLDVVPPSN